MSEEETGFVIKDRRHFTSGGETRPEEEKQSKEEKSGSAPEKKEAEPSKSKPLEDAEKVKETAPFPEVTFSTLLLSLVSSSLVHLGEVPDPTTGETKTELAMVKHTIDTIAMLKEKTVGNLTSDEEKMIEHVLYDLRMRYVAASK